MRFFIENSDTLGWGRFILTVLFIPNKLERLLGVKSIRRKFKTNGERYMIGGRKWYNYPDMTVHGHAEDFDSFVNRKEEDMEGKLVDKTFSPLDPILVIALFLFFAFFSFFLFFRTTIDSGPLVILEVVMGTALIVCALYIPCFYIKRLKKGNTLFF